MSSARLGVVMRVKPRKPLPDTRRALRTLREGIVAAGVEEDDLFGGRTEGLEQLLRLDRAERLLVVAVHLHVGRRDDVFAGELHAVAGIVDERGRRLVGGLLESLQRVEKVGPRDVVVLEHLEAMRLENAGDRLGVGHRIHELGEGGIVAVADDQGDAPRLGRGGGKHEN